MPLYYLKENLTVKGTLRKKATLSSLSELPEESLNVLLERGKIRLLIAPPLNSFVPLRKYATILKKKGIESLEDFVLADEKQLSKIPNAAGLQAEALDFLHPDKPLKQKLEDEDCCGDSPSSIPVSDKL